MVLGGAEFQAGLHCLGEALLTRGARCNDELASERAHADSWLTGRSGWFFGTSSLDCLRIARHARRFRRGARLSGHRLRGFVHSRQAPLPFWLQELVIGAMRSRRPANTGQAGTLAVLSRSESPSSAGEECRVEIDAASVSPRPTAGFGPRVLASDRQFGRAERSPSWAGWKDV